MNEATTAAATPVPRPGLTRSGLGSLGSRGLAWGLAVLLTVYLGLSGGGYDIVVRSEIGLLVWWFVLLGVLVGVLPHGRLPRVSWIAVGLLAGFLAWTWIGLSWSSSHELTLTEVGRLSTYLGVLLLGLCALTLETARPLVNGLGCGIAAVSTLAILSKLAPGLFPADTARSFYATPRLSYPFDYADGVGEYAALGLPLVFYMATSGRTLAGRAAATAALAPVLLCLAMTVSRGGVLAAVAGMIAFWALVPDRIPRLPTLAITAAGIAILMAALLHRAALRDSVAAAPAHERHSMLVILIVVVVAVALAQALALLVMRRLTRPRWLRISRRGAQGVTAGIVAAAVLVVIIGFASGTVSHMWHDFKLWEPEKHSNQYFRLLSLAGSHRYQYWQIAWKAFESSPLHGIGSGTFRYYWAQHTTHAEYIQNAHSLWFETLAETGIVGWLLIAGFFGLITIGGVIRALRAAGERRTLIATATAGVIAFCAAASFDWVWQIGVVPMVAMLLAAVSLLPEPGPVGQPAASGPRASWALRGNAGPRLLLGLGSLLALVLIAVPLASTVSLRASQKAVAAGDLAKALDDANTAQAIEPGAASPYLQQALVLEQANDINGASAAILAAISREPTNSQLWLIASRIATESDQPGKAVADYRRAQELYPTSSEFLG
jgi:O-Antigen ligase